jgi:hypothetical protein
MDFLGRIYMLETFGELTQPRLLLHAAPELILSLFARGDVVLDADSIEKFVCRIATLEDVTSTYM